MSANIVLKPLYAVTNTHKVRWYKASQKDLNSYKLRLDFNLEHVNIPWDAVHCGNMFCNEHHDDIQSLYDNIINECLNATPKVCNGADKKSTNRLPGWNNLVQDLHHTAMFWLSIWKSFRSPNVGIIANIRHSTRAKYYYSVTPKRQKDNTAADKLAHELLNNNYTNFWNGIKNSIKRLLNFQILLIILVVIIVLLSYLGRNMIIFTTVLHVLQWSYNQ